MSLPQSQIMARLRAGVCLAGFLAVLAGLDWLWKLQAIWPRTMSDPVPHPLLEALGVVIAGLYLVNKGR